MNHQVRRALRVTFLAALAACLVVPATVAARSGPAAGPASASPELRISIGTRCMDGVGFLAKDTVRLTQRRGTKTLTDVTFTTSGTEFSRCLAAPVAVGDKVRFVRKVGSKVKQQRTVTVPDLRISGDLEQNTLSVSGTVGGSPVAAYLGIGTYGYIAGLDNGGLNTAAILEPDGTSVVDLDGYWTMAAGDRAYVSYDTPDDDRIYRWWAPVSMVAQVGKSTVTGNGKPGGSLSLTLRASGGAIRATATAKVGRTILPNLRAYEASAAYATVFRKNGTPVVAKAGDRIGSTGMDAAGATLLANDFQATAGDGDATLTGTCRAGSRVGLSHGRYVEWSTDTADGQISASDLTLTSGDKLVIGCQTADGFGQRFPVTVP